MKLTLTITASADALAKILASLPGDSNVDVAPVQTAPVAAPVQSAPVAITEGPLVEASAPVAPAVMPEVVAAAPTIAGEPEFDSTGLAWDERIHSKQKGQTNDGKWRKQRGVDENYYKQVEAELRARYGAQAPTHTDVVLAAVPIEPIAVAIPQPVMPMPIAPMGNVPPMPIMSMPNADMEHQVDDVDNVASEPMPVPVMQAPGDAPVTFHTIMMHIGPAIGAGTITPEYLVQLVSEINQQCGTSMQSFTDMAAFPQTVEYCWAALARDGKR